MSNSAETESWTDKIWKYINVFLNTTVVYIIISMYSVIQLGEQEKRKEIFPKGGYFKRFLLWKKNGAVFFLPDYG